MGALGRLGGGDQLDHFNFCPQKSVSLSTTKIQNYEAQNIRHRFSKCIFLKLFSKVYFWKVYPAYAFSKLIKFIKVQIQMLYPVQWGWRWGWRRGWSGVESGLRWGGQRDTRLPFGRKPPFFSLCHREAEDDDDYDGWWWCNNDDMMMTILQSQMITPMMKVQCQISQRHWGRIDDGFEERCPNDSADGLNE